MRAVAIALALAACSHADDPNTPYAVAHLAIDARHELDLEQFYTRVRAKLDGPHTARVARRGNRLVLITSALGCSTLRSIEDILPNGGEVECRDGDTGHVVWLVVRDVQLSQ